MIAPKHTLLRTPQDWEIVLDDDRYAREKLTAEQVFADIECDSGEQVTMPEFIKAMNVINPSFPPSMARKIFRRLDDDKSNTISYDEFKAHWGT